MSLQSVLAILTSITVTITTLLCLATALLYLLSIRLPAASFYARLLASYISLVACAIFGVISSIALRLAGRGGISQWATARAFKYTMALTTAVTFTISDPNDYLGRTRPAVFIGNHQTELDVLMLGCIFPQYCSVTAKSSLRSMPFLGWFMSLSGTVFIDRGNSSSAREAMASAADEITRRQQSVYMFPEGTRSYYKEPGLLPFKKGAFHLAVQAKVPIVPVVVANYSDVLDVKRRIFTSGKIAVKVLKPIETANLTPADVEDLARDTRELMLAEIIALTEVQRGNPLSAIASKQGAAKVNGSKVAAS